VFQKEPRDFRPRQRGRAVSAQHRSQRWERRPARVLSWHERLRLLPASSSAAHDTPWSLTNRNQTEAGWEPHGQPHTHRRPTQTKTTFGKEHLPVSKLLGRQQLAAFPKVIVFQRLPRGQTTCGVQHEEFLQQIQGLPRHAVCTGSHHHFVAHRGVGGFPVNTYSASRGKRSCSLRSNCGGLRKSTLITSM
jgi:hypothetical protein